MIGKLNHVGVATPSIAASVALYRDLLGATNPENALAGTLRADYADSFTENGTHGSDSLESAKREIAFFFAEGEVCPRTR